MGFVCVTLVNTHRAVLTVFQNVASREINEEAFGFINLFVVCVMSV